MPPPGGIFICPQSFRGVTTGIGVGEELLRNVMWWGCEKQRLTVTYSRGVTIKRSSELSVWEEKKKLRRPFHFQVLETFVPCCWWWMKDESGWWCVSLGSAVLINSVSLICLSRHDCLHNSQIGMQPGFVFTFHGHTDRFQRNVTVLGFSSNWTDLWVIRNYESVSEDVTRSHKGSICHSYKNSLRSLCVEATSFLNLAQMVWPLEQPWVCSQLLIQQGHEESRLRYFEKSYQCEDSLNWQLLLRHQNQE